MTKIIEPKKKVMAEFAQFCADRFDEEDFGIGNAANMFFKHKFNTDLDWTDIKNLTGAVARLAEKGDYFKFTETKTNKLTNREAKHYRIIYK